MPLASEPGAEPKHPRPTIALPETADQLALVQAIAFARQVAMWNIEEIMMKAEEVQRTKEIKARKDGRSTLMEEEVLSIRATEAKVLAQFERTLGRLVMLEQKLAAVKSHGRSRADKRERVVAKVHSAAARARAGGTDTKS